MVEYYATNKEIKAEFFRSSKDFPSTNTVDSDTNKEWKLVISDHVDTVLNNRTGTRLTDVNGILKDHFMMCYRRKLDGVDWRLTQKEKKELRHLWRKPALYMHHPQDYTINTSG